MTFVKELEQEFAVCHRLSAQPPALRDANWQGSEARQKVHIALEERAAARRCPCALCDLQWRAADSPALLNDG